MPVASASTFRLGRSTDELSPARRAPHPLGASSALVCATAGRCGARHVFRATPCVLASVARWGTAMHCLSCFSQVLGTPPLELCSRRQASRLRAPGLPLILPTVDCSDVRKARAWRHAFASSQANFPGSRQLRLQAENTVWQSCFVGVPGWSGAGHPGASRRLRRLTGDKRHISAPVGSQIVIVAPAQAPPRLCRCGPLPPLRNGVYRLALCAMATVSLLAPLCSGPLPSMRSEARKGCSDPCRVRASPRPRRRRPSIPSRRHQVPRHPRRRAM
mgnify:CR=1 FL=1